jgi:O-succinylbenzoate synthase
METVDALLDEIDGAIESGFKRTKLKFRPGWDLAMLEAVRGRFPDYTIHVDCNSAYRIADAPMLEKLDQFGLAMVEQPLANDDLYDHATLAKRLATPICLDESITSVDRARKAASLSACGWINIKPGRLGGITVARQVLESCRANHIPCWVGGMLESSLGGHQCLALATLDNISYPSDVFPSSRFYRTDLSDPPLELAGPSTMCAPDTPGSGATPNAERLVDLATGRIVVSA